MNHFHKNNIKNPYVGVVHRLDKPVAGVIIYGKNEKATSNLSTQITNRQCSKRYYAIVCGDANKIFTSSSATVDNNLCTLNDYLLRDAKTNTSHVIDINDKNYSSNKEVKKCSLRFSVVKTIELSSDSSLYCENSPYNNILSIVDIELLTGRHHQIRVQFSHSGCPLWGDLKYSPYASDLRQKKGVALCARSLSITHPTTKKEMTFSVIPSNSIFRTIDMQS